MEKEREIENARLQRPLPLLPLLTKGLIKNGLHEHYCQGLAFDRHSGACAFLTGLWVATCFTS